MDELLKKQLKEKLELMKADGLDLGEDAAKKLIKYSFELANSYIFLSKNKYDDLLLAVMPMIEKELLALADKIDGEEG